MKQEHTPRPWKKLITGTIKDPYFEISGGKYSATIAMTMCGINSEADARLIAASPDLLEASKAALVYIKSDPAVWPLIEQLKAAVSKAEGNE